MKVKLTQGQTALIDDEDYSLISPYRWHAHYEPKIDNYYAQSKGKDEYGVHLRMHRVIMKCPKDMEVDHINHNTLDNRKVNLRIVTRSQNQMNRGKQSNNTSGVVGVVWDKTRKKWAARIKKEGIHYNLGRYKEKEDAVRARKEAEISFFGEFRYKGEVI